MKQSTCITLGFCQYNLIDSTYNLKNQLSIQQQQQQHLRPASFQTTTSSSVLSAIANSDEENDSNDSIDNVQLPRTQQQDPSMFFELMSPIDTVKPEQMSASSLAYLGDVVFELFVRSRYVWPSRRMSDLQNKVVSVVRGKMHIFISYVICICMLLILLLSAKLLIHTEWVLSYIAEAQSILLQK